MKAKIFVSLITLLLSGPVQALTLITCAAGDYKIGLNVDGMTAAQPPLTNYVIYKGKDLVKTGMLKKLSEGYESKLLNAYTWTFENTTENIYIGVGTPDLQRLEPGEWQGSADIAVSLPGTDIQAASANCKITINK